MTPANPETGRIRTLVTGQSPGLEPVRAALESHEDLEVVGAAPSVATAIETLAAVEVDVVLLAAPGPTFPSAEVAAIREHGDAPIVLLAPSSAPELLERALEADLADALLLPQPPQSVVFAIRRVAGAREHAATARRPETGRILTVFSPKGGTGKTAAAVNLAVALQRCENRRTLLVDFDLQFGDCAIMLGLRPERTIHDLVAAPGELDADKVSGYVTRHTSGLDLLAAPTQPEDAELVAVGRLTRLLEVARESYDAVVIDTPPLLGGSVLTALDHTDTLLLLATLDVPTLKDVRQSLETLELIAFPSDRIAMVLNRADAPVGLTRAEVERAFGRSFEYALPEDRRVPLAVNRSVPVTLSEPRSDYARSVRDLAAAVLARARPRSLEPTRTAG